MTGGIDLPTAELLGEYALGPVESVTLLPGGKNQHHHLVTPAGAFVVRRSCRSKTAAALDAEHELVAFLRQHGYPAPEAATTGDGRSWTTVGGRLYTVWVYVPGRPFSAEEPGDLVAAARALAAYHHLVDRFEPRAPRQHAEGLGDRLADRLAEVLALGGGAPGRAADADAAGHRALATLPYAVEEAQRTLGVLARLAPVLPRTLVHGGCRRGSLRFRGPELAAVLDFDSARREARVVDLGIAVHDFAKRYGDPRSHDYKVALDLEVAARFLGAYAEVNRLDDAEIEVLPALLAAKRLNRSLGRFRRLLEGTTTPGDAPKVALEMARVRWLAAHADELRAALAGTRV